MFSTGITKKHGMDVYMYFRRNNRILYSLHKINGKTWADAARILGVSIPQLFIILEHAKRAGIIAGVRIK